MNERGSATVSLSPRVDDCDCLRDRLRRFVPPYIFIFAAFFVRAAHGKSVPLKIASLYSFPRLCLRFSLLCPTRATRKYSLRRTIARASDTSRRVPSVSRAGCADSADLSTWPIRRELPLLSYARCAADNAFAKAEGGRVSRRDFASFGLFSRDFGRTRCLSRSETLLPVPSRKCHRPVTEFDKRMADIGGTGERKREREREREQFYVPNCRIEIKLEKQIT